MNTKQKQQVAKALLAAADALEAKSKAKAASTADGKATVKIFLMVLTGALTQYDARLSKRQPNTYRLGHFLGAAQKVEADVRRLLDSDDPKALQMLVKSINRRFIVNDMPPAKKVIKAIHEYVTTGKVPKYGKYA